MAGLTTGSGSTSSSDSVTEDFSPRHTYAEDPAIIVTSGEGSPPLASIGTTAPFSKASLQLQTESGHNPTRWKCKGYGPADDYVYFDGAEGTSDLRFLIDLESPSMERLRDVRPYLYYIGYWNDDAIFPPPVSGDEAVEDYYVKAGREFLRSARDRGEGYFLADRDWALYNQGEDATMPHILCIGEQDERDVGLDDYHPYGNESLDYVRNLVITNIRQCLPDQEVLTPLAYETWDKFICLLYAGHSIVSMYDTGWTVEECQHQTAVWHVSSGELMEEALYLYLCPRSPYPIKMRPAEARKEMERVAAARAAAG